MHALGALGLAIIGCTSSIGLNTAEGDPPAAGVEAVPGRDPDPVETGPDPVSDPLFDVTRVHEVRFEVDADATTALTEDPRAYTVAVAVIDGERFEPVGVRLKGNNSFRTLDQKPSWKVRLDAFVPGQSFGRLRGLTLNNMIEDATFAKEMLTYWLWNDAGMVAPRAAYAKVYVNDTYYGIYALLESYDEAFVQRRFSDPSGDMWEGEDDADFTPEGVPFFDHKFGEGDHGQLETVADALAEPTDDYYASADRYFQMDQVIDYWAWTMATANLDAYPYTLNDYVLYADPAAGGRMTMSPWGMDESWNPEFAFQWGVGVALFGCAADPACMARVKERTEAALRHCEEVDAAGQLEAFYALSADAVAADNRVSWTPLDVATARADLLAFVRAWPDTLRAQMAESP